MIHTTAIIDKNTVIDPSVEIGPYSVIKERCKIGRGVKIGCHTIIHEDSQIGSGTIIDSHCNIGTDPNIVGFDNNIISGVVIGSNNTIHNAVTICRSNIPGHNTVIGESNNLSAYVYIAHDCRIRNRVFISSHASIGGESNIDDYANIGMSAVLHQFTCIGKHVMVGAQAKIIRDVLPYALADGNPPNIKKANSVGLERHGFEENDIKEITDIFFELSKSSYPELTNQDIDILFSNNTSKYLQEIIAFIKQSSRGCCKIKLSKKN